MYRPTNEVLGRLAFLANTRGIIPNPDTATRVNEDNSVSGAASATIYTVPVGKVLFISSVALDVRCGATVGAGYIAVYNASGDRQYYISVLTFVVASTREHAERYFCPALEAAAGWYIAVVGSAATVVARAQINGWLEAV